MRTQPKKLMLSQETLRNLVQRPVGNQMIMSTEPHCPGTSGRTHDLACHTHGECDM